MSTKLLIVCPGRPNVNGAKRRTFHWNPAYECYVHENRMFDETELNGVIEAVFKKNADLRPFVKVVEFSDGKTADSVAPAVSIEEHESLKLRYKKLQERIGGPPVSTITGGAEITLEEAIDVVRRLAPERLRKQSIGRVAARKPAEMAVG